jgi:hypothetical protein
MGGFGRKRLFSRVIICKSVVMLSVLNLAHQKKTVKNSTAHERLMWIERSYKDLPPTGF